MRKFSMISAIIVFIFIGAFLTGCGEKKVEKINFSWWGNDDRHQATQKAIDAFNTAHKGEIEVVGQPSGFGNLDEVFATRYAGGNPSDVITVIFPWVLQYSPHGDGFYDLDKVKDIFDFSQYDPKFLAAGKTGGSQQVIPYGQNTLCFFANKSAYQRLGISEIPKTFEEYKAAAKKFTAKIPNTYLIVSPTFRFAAIYYLQQKTGRSEFAEDLSMNYTVDDYREALSWYKNLVDAHVFCSRKDYIENVGSNPVSIAQNAKYIQGGYVGVLEWSGGVASNAATLAEKGDQMVIANLPIIDGAVFKGTMAKPSMTFAISKSSKSPRAAAEFLQYILNDSAGVKLLGSTRGMVASRSAKAELEKSGQITGPVKEAYDFTEKTQVINNSPIFEDAIFTNAYESNYEAFEFGKLTAKQAAQAIYDANSEEVAKLKKQYGKEGRSI